VKLLWTDSDKLIHHQNTVLSPINAPLKGRIFADINHIYYFYSQGNGVFLLNRSGPELMAPTNT
jgi:hypothetical protein